jgi:hypothetical protein
MPLAAFAALRSSAAPCLISLFIRSGGSHPCVRFDGKAGSGKVKLVSS